MAYIRNSSRRNGRSRGNRININKVYTSNGPGGSVRGTAHQVANKYCSYARDAENESDRALMYTYYQYAEHFQVIVNDYEEQKRDSETEQKDQSQLPNVSSSKKSSQKAGQKQPELEQA